MGLGFIIPESYNAAATEEKKDLLTAQRKYTKNVFKFDDLIEQRQKELESIPITDVFKRRDKQMINNQTKTIKRIFWKRIMKNKYTIKK